MDSSRFWHLLNVPWADGGETMRGLDCWGVCKHVARLLGYPLDREEEAIDARWIRVGTTYRDARQQGDIISSCGNVVLPGDDPSETHASIVTNPEKCLVMSACHDAGVYQAKSYSIANIVAVYRWSGAQ